MDSLGQKLRHMRTMRGLSMNKLADMAGVSQPTISLIESGKNTNVTKETLEKLATALKVSVDYFLDEGARTVMEMIDCISRSHSSTWRSSLAIAWARLNAIVVLPTPPLMLMIEIIFAIRFLLSISVYQRYALKIIKHTKV